jgi:ABC-type spermidine/putrescine transport system permease subunit I
MGQVQSGTRRLTEAVSKVGHYTALLFPLVFMAAFFLIPLMLTFVWSFWDRAGFWMEPGFELDAYRSFFRGARFFILRRSLVVAGATTAIGLVLAYTVAYIVHFRLHRDIARAVLLLFTVPFVVNYIIRNLGWVALLQRQGGVNDALESLGVIDKPLSWLLFTDFSVLVGLIASYMPFMIYPIWLGIAGIDRGLIEASWLLGARPVTTFWRVTLPLSMPGVFAAIIFGFVGTFGESAVPIILGGVGYQMMGNTITSSLDVLNYPLAAAMSSVVIASMLVFLFVWYMIFDIKTFLGKIVRWSG